VFPKGNLNGRGRLRIRAGGEQWLGHRSVASAFSFFQRFTPSLHRVTTSGLPGTKKRPWTCAIVRSLTFTSIIGGTRARFYPLLDLNSMEPPIGPHSERGYFAALE
jgi:hypothetical protein